MQTPFSVNPSEYPAKAGLITTFVRHPNAANLLMTLMIIFGVAGVANLQTQFFPTIEINTISITTSWPGATAEDTADNILGVIEPDVRFLDGVDRIVSYGREGSATVALEFKPGTDMQKALSDVQSTVGEITTFPESAETPKVSLREWTDRVAKISLSGPFTEKALRVYAKNLRDGLLDAGIDSVSFDGLRDEEIQVSVSERELRRLGLTVEQVSTIISQNSADVPSGTIEGSIDKQVRALSSGEDAQAIGNINIIMNSGGDRLQLKDIAQVRPGFDESQTRNLVNGVPAIDLIVARNAGSDLLDQEKILKEYLAQVSPTLPPTLDVNLYDVRSEAVNERINLLITNGLGGLVLVVTVLFIFLNARIAFWVTAGIPIALLATLGLMWVSGQTINMISLFALIMTLGIIVDDAIVVGEHTATRLQMGDPPPVAAENGAGHMILPVMAASLTTVAAFMPLLLVSGRIGQFMSALPLVVVAVLVASLIECFLVLPGHLRHGSSKTGNNRFLRVLFLAAIFGCMAALVWMGLEFRTPTEWLDLASIYFTPLVGLMFLGLALLAVLVRWGFERFRNGAFKAFVRLTFRFRYATVAASLSVLAISIALNASGRIGFEFFPSPETERVRAVLVFASGTPEATTVAALQRIEKSLYQLEERIGDGEDLISNVVAEVGQSGNNRGDNLAQLEIELTPSEVRSVRTSEFVNQWRRSAPKIAGLERMAIFALQGGPRRSDQPLEIRLQNGTPEHLKNVALDLQERLAGIPGVSSLQDDLPYGKPESVMELTPRGVALGFTIDDVGRQVRDAFEGRIASRLAVGDDEVKIRVERSVETEGTATLANLDLLSPSGQYVPLSEIVTQRERIGFDIVLHYAGKPTVTVSGDVDFDVITEEELADFLTAPDGPLEELRATYNIDYEMGGETEDREQAFGDLFNGVIVAMCLIYIILAWIFASYTRPFAVMLIIPFGVVGAIWGHYLLDFKFTILSFFGILGLAGILVNDSLILVRRLDERLTQGESLEDASVGASVDRFRAVLLTSLTTIGGLLPLLFEKSLQAQFLLPMAISIVFGIGVATVFVLFFVPAVVGIGGDISNAARFIAGMPKRRRNTVAPA